MEGGRHRFPRESYRRRSINQHDRRDRRGGFFSSSSLLQERVFFLPREKPPYLLYFRATHTHTHIPYIKTMLCSISIKEEIFMLIAPCRIINTLFSARAKRVKSYWHLLSPLFDTCSHDDLARYPDSFFLIDSRRPTGLPLGEKKKNWETTKQSRGVDKQQFFLFLFPSFPGMESQSMIRFLGCLDGRCKRKEAFLSRRRLHFFFKW